MALMLLLETAMIGVFLALDLVLFFVFFEASLIPMYFLIGAVGRAEPGLRRGQVLPLHLRRLGADGRRHPAGLLQRRHLRHCRAAKRTCPAVQMWGFLAFALAFAVKTPLFPFHTWLPDAHVQAPTAGSIILAGVLLKMGTYGYPALLAMPIFPDAARSSARCWRRWRSSASSTARWWR
jgi:NADH-quinone oxidoreductase subunit M